MECVVWNLAAAGGALSWLAGWLVAVSGWLGLRLAGAHWLCSGMSGCLCRLAGGSGLAGVWQTIDWLIVISYRTVHSIIFSLFSNCQPPEFMKDTIVGKEKLVYQRAPEKWRRRCCFWCCCYLFSVLSFLWHFLCVVVAGTFWCIRIYTCIVILRYDQTYCYDMVFRYEQNHFGLAALIFSKLQANRRASCPLLFLPNLQQRTFFENFVRNFQTLRRSFLYDCSTTLHDRRWRTTFWGSTIQVLQIKQLAHIPSLSAQKVQGSRLRPRMPWTRNQVFCV